MTLHTPFRLLVAAALTLAAVGGGVASTAKSASFPPPTPGIACDKGSLPEKVQGRAPLSDVATGRYAKGYRCNAVQVSHYGHTGGYRVERYVDKAGHECGYYDTSLLHPAFLADQFSDAPNAATGPGTWVMDMSNPAKPVHTDTLRALSFQSPHESLRVNHKRGLIVANFANPVAHPGIVDVWDISQDCRHPQPLSSTPLGILGHEGGFSPDGNTYYVASLYAHTLAAVDLTNPRVPTLLWLSYAYQPHGVSLSNDGNTLYMAEGRFREDMPGFKGLTILDVSQIQKRAPNPQVPMISRLTWPNVGTPQNATPFTMRGHKYLMEIDEFGSGSNIGAGRIIDIQNPRKPFVVSNLRLAVNQPNAQNASLEADPGNSEQFQGYQGHYCTLPSRVDPQIIACTFIMSGLRVFDISNVTKPKEIAYFNKPILEGERNTPRRLGAFAMSAPAYDQATGDIWYSDGNSGLYVVRLTGAAKRKHFAKTVVLPGN